MADRQANVLRELDGLRVEVGELLASRKRLALAFDAERRTIERALHDGVQQQLVGFAANLQLAAVAVETDPAAAKELLKEMGRDAQEALEETRELAHRIYPPMLEAGGLKAALRSAAVSANVPIRIDIAGETSCPPEIAGAVYFCCLEVLERAAVGTTVAISVGNENGALVFEVVADRDVEMQQLSTPDRVEALGGRLTVRSSSNETRVAGLLPLSG